MLFVITHSDSTNLQKPRVCGNVMCCYKIYNTINFNEYFPNLIHQ